MKKLLIIFITISLSFLKFNLCAIEAPNNVIITTINKGDSSLGLSKQGDILTVNFDSINKLNFVFGSTFKISNSYQSSTIFLLFFEYLIDFMLELKW